MLGIKTFAKMAKGGMGPDELAEMLSAMGVEIEMVPVPLPDAQLAYRNSAVEMSRPGARLHRLSGRMKNGDRLEALLVLVPARPSTTGVLTPDAIAV